MVSTISERVGRVLAASGLAAVIGVLVFAAAFVVARGVFREQAQERLDIAVGAAEGHVSFRLNQSLDVLRHIADDLVAAGSPTPDLGTRRDAVLPRTMRGAVVVDAAGRVQEAVPTGALLQLPAAGLAALADAARSSGSTVWERSVEGVTGLGVLLVAIPVPGPPMAASAVVGVLDPGELARALDTDPLVGGQGLVFLSRGGGEVVAATGRQGAAGRVEEIFPAGSPASAVASLARGQVPPQPIVAEWGGRRERFLAASKPLEGVPGQWAVAAVLPARVALEPAQGLFLVGGVGAAALIALWIGFAVSCVRADDERRAALAEVERARRLATRSDLESRCRFMVEQAAMPLLLLRDQEVVAMSQQAAVLLGEARRWAVVGRQLTELVEESDRGAVSEFLLGSPGEAKAPRTLRTRLRTPDGRRLGVEFTATDIGSEASGPTFRALAIRDLEQSERCEALLGVLADSDPRAVVVLDLQGVITWVNRALCEHSGFRAADLVGREAVSMVVAADRRRAQALFGRAARGEASSTVVRVNVAGGHGLLAEVEAVPLQAQGLTLGVVVMGQELQRGGQAGGLAEPQLGALAANLSSALAHRLGNDLQALLGLLGRARREGTPFPDEGEIRQLLDRATTEVQKLVAVGRIGTAGLRLLRLGGLVERWAQRRASTLPPSLRLSVRRAASEDRIVGDGLQLSLVLDLVVDAVVAQSVGGGGAVEVALEDGPVAGTVRLSIADTGAALAEAGGDTGETPGLLVSRGTAVALAEAVARRHGGQCGHRQRAGLGNLLWLDLPTSRGERAAAPGPAPQGSGGAVLVADDEALVREALASALRERGLEVVEAWDGAMVVDLVGQDPRRFALVVLDIVMPRMGGREAYQRLRELAPTLPVLVCTGYEPGGEETLEGAEAIIKPFSIDDFVARVEEILGRAGGAANPGGRLEP
mgnify:CR=1 FL=1